MPMTYQDLIEGTTTPLTDERCAQLLTLAQQDVDSYGMTFQSFIDD